MGMPKYVVWLKRPYGNGFAINKHPKCKFKSFMLKKYNNDMDKCKVAVIEYLNQL